MRQQPETAWVGAAQLSRHVQVVSSRSRLWERNGDQRAQARAVQLHLVVHGPPVHGAAAFVRLRDKRYPIWIGPSGSPQAAAYTQVAALLCPSDPKLDNTYNMAYTAYAGSEGFHWWKTGHVSTLPAYGGQCERERVANFPVQADLMNVFAQTKTRKFANIRDGTSNTIIAAEVCALGYKWGKGWCAVGGGEPRLNGAEPVFRAAFVAVCSGAYPIECNHPNFPWPDPAGGTTWPFPAGGPSASGPTYHAAHGPNNDWPGSGSLHPGGHNSLFGDGSVAFTTETIEWHIWMKLNAMADGYAVSH